MRPSPDLGQICLSKHCTGSIWQFGEACGCRMVRLPSRFCSHRALKTAKCFSRSVLKGKSSPDMERVSFGTSFGTPFLGAFFPEMQVVQKATILSTDLAVSSHFCPKVRGGHFGDQKLEKYDLPPRAKTPFPDLKHP